MPNPVIRRQLNLLKHKKKSSHRKSQRWYIAKSQSNAVFYLADFDDDNNTALWCRYMKDAMSFHTEQGVLQYLSTYLNNRTDVHLILADK